MNEVHKILYSMVIEYVLVQTCTKYGLVAYQLKDVAQVWYKMWVHGRAPGEVLITWDFLKTILRERFFPKDQREAKVEDFINLNQGGMLVKEYSLKLLKLSKYASSHVSSSRDSMNSVLTDVS